MSGQKLEYTIVLIPWLKRILVCMSWHNQVGLQ